MSERYWFVARPADVSHHHPFLVFTDEDALHFELTVFGKEAAASVCEKTVHAYLHTLLPFFLFLDTDEWQVRAGRRWDAPPTQVRQAILDYLIQRQCCQVRQHHLGFHLVSPTAGTSKTLHLFLTALRFFYRVMCQRGYYAFANPLIDPTLRLVASEGDRGEQESLFPTISGISGVAEPHTKRYVSDNYFKLEGIEWIPQVIDDPTLFRRILEGGNLVHWRLREMCVTRLLFETGARISEIVDLSLFDWIARGTQQEANACSKGSHGRRVKFLRFSTETSKLLRRYVNGERRHLDRHGYSLEDYLRQAQHSSHDLLHVPLFLSAQRTPLSAKTFRENYWYPACRAAGLSVRIHQIRHWHTTQAVRQIYETSSTEGETQRRLQELVVYMKWRSKETLTAYEHYFNAARHAERLESLHERMQADLQNRLERRSQLQPSPAQQHTLPPGPASDEPDVLFLYHLGGEDL